jgi:hypothetical protein
LPWCSRPANRSNPKTTIRNYAEDFRQKIILSAIATYVPLCIAVAFGPCTADAVLKVGAAAIVHDIPKIFGSRK